MTGSSEHHVISLRRGLPARLTAAICVLASLTSSGLAKPTEPTRATAVAAQENLSSRISEVRSGAWHTAIEITDVYEKISPERCPGIAALVVDIRAAQRRVGEGPSFDLSRFDVDRVVTHNPNFWRAALEVSPSDGSFSLLHATLLASAGEIWRAYRVLCATTQLLPISAEARPYYLAHLYGLGSLMATASRTGEIPTSDFAAVSQLERGLAAWPKNAVLLHELVDLRMRLVLAEGMKLKKGNQGGRGFSEVQSNIKSYHAELERLFALDPIRAAPFRGNPSQRADAQRLNAQWAKMTDADNVLGYKEVRELGDLLESADIPDLALVLRRIEVVARGFPGPSDLAAWRRLLPKLIGAQATDALFSAVDRGDINVVDLDQNDPPSMEDWKGDPAIHPLVLQQVQREIGDLSFRIKVLTGNSPQQADSLQQRALLESRAGLYEAALSDVEKAISLVGRKPDLLLDEVGMYSALGYTERAEALLREVESTADGRRLALRERGLLRFGQGRYSEALEALRDDAKKDPRAIYSALIAELAARRVGGTQKELLQVANRQIPSGSWPDTCLAFLIGKISDEQLLIEAQRGDSLEIAQRLCEAYFILGETALASGERSKAIDLLESCIGTGITGYVEFRLARQELRRLEGAETSRRKNLAPPPSDAPHAPNRPIDGAPHQDDDGESDDLPA